jgi:uncharacterized integral membrane protein
MTDDKIEFRTHYIKGMGVYYVLFIAGLLSAFSIFLIFIVNNLVGTLIFILPAFTLPFVILFFKSRKVIIGTDYVESVSLFGKRRIYIKDVNKFGIFVSGSYTLPKVTSQSKINDLDDEELFLHQIYLTKNTEFDLDSFRPMEHVNFRYRREIYFRLKEMIETRDALHTTKCM